MSIYQTTVVDDNHRTAGMSVVTALTACQIARSSDESARNALMHAEKPLLALSQSQELAVKERRAADHICDAVRIFKDRLEELELQSIKLWENRNEARHCMLNAADDSEALAAGRRMLAAERQHENVSAQALVEQERICNLVGFERKDMQPFTWHSELMSLSSARRNKAVESAGKAKSAVETADREWNRSQDELARSTQALSVAEADLEIVVRRTIAEIVAA